MKYLLSYFLSVIFLSAFSQNNPDDILGKWVNAEGDARFEIFKQGPIYNAKIIWLKHPNNGSGEQKIDIKNPNEKLRTRTILGLEFLTGLTYSIEKHIWLGGKVYSPEKGITADCKIIINSKIELTLIASKFLITNEKKWTRYE